MVYGATAQVLEALEHLQEVELGQHRFGWLVRTIRACHAKPASVRILPRHTRSTVHSGALKGGHPVRRDFVLLLRCAGYVPSTHGVDSMRNSDSSLARLDVLVALVITPDLIASARRARCRVEGCWGLVPHAA